MSEYVCTVHRQNLLMITAIVALALSLSNTKEALSGIIPVAASKSHAEYNVLFDEEEHRKTPYTKNTIEILNLLLVSLVHMTSHSRKHPKAKFHRRCLRKYS